MVVGQAGRTPASDRADSCGSGATALLKCRACRGQARARRPESRPAVAVTTFLVGFIDESNLLHLPQSLVHRGR
eukprot:351204-Chlamydomonas_euryale.AAC.1